jgi:prolyl 4-hydroxylase
MIASELDVDKPFIFEVPDILTSDECAQWIDRIRSAGTEPAPINTRRGNTVDSQIRNNRRAIFDDPDQARLLLKRVGKHAPREIHEMVLERVNERFRCYEYQVGQRFAPHSDGAFVRSEDEQSWYTFMVYLNDGFDGGETAFFVEPEVIIRPRQGSGLLFQHPIIHEGREVKAGVKYVLRTDLMYCRQ